MDELQFGDLPKLEDALFVAAFPGWNDSAGAASWAVKFLINHWDAREFARIDPDDFYDFSVTRPVARISDGSLRQFIWPRPRFYVYRAGRDGDQRIGRDCVLLLADEPQRRWKAFCGLLIRVMRQCHVSEVALLGALGAAVPHTIPVQVVGIAHRHQNSRPLREQDIGSANYEGPVGILTTFHEIVRRQGLAVTSLWGSVPYYVSARPNLPVAEALLRRMNVLYNLDVRLDELTRAASRFNQSVDGLVRADQEVASYVRELERRAGELRDGDTSSPFSIAETSPRLRAAQPDLPSPQEAVEDVEALLRKFREQTGED